MKSITVSNLSDYCRWGYSKQFFDMLNAAEIKEIKLDLSYAQGSCFLHTIRHNNINMLSALIDYYKKNNLQDLPNSVEYKIAKEKLRKILDEIFDDIDHSEEISNDIIKLVSLYITPRPDFDFRIIKHLLNEAGLHSSYLEDPIHIQNADIKDVNILQLDLFNLKRSPSISLQQKELIGKCVKMLEDHYGVKDEREMLQYVRGRVEEFQEIAHMSDECFNEHQHALRCLEIAEGLRGASGGI